MNTSLRLPSTMRVLERGWLSSNNILFAGRETALVDSGYLTHAPQTVVLVAHALQGRRLERLLNTHLHSDHCGGNAGLQQVYACRTTIPAAELAKVRAWDEAALSFKATGQQCARFTADDVWQPGDVIDLGDMQWQVLGAPGHDPHSVILYCPDERILVSADALWENGFGVIFPELAGEPGFAETRATLELIAALDVRLVIPGHGVVFSNVQKALDTAFSRIDYLAANPVRNAVKVLLKFLLLERQSIPLNSLPQLMSAIPLFREANRRYLQLTEQQLAQWAGAQLVHAGAARLAADALCNHDA
jgi:glyoxylase-like metal-dependent hydrolase (beta-lactamase superfamily II)